MALGHASVFLLVALKEELPAYYIYMRDTFSVRIGIAIVLLLFFGGLVAFSRQRFMPPVSPEAPSTTRLIEPTESVVVPSDWPVHVSENQPVQIAYPPLAQVREVEKVLVVYHHGATQTEGTELFDGFTVTLQTVAFTEGQTSLQEVAEDRLANDRQHATVTRPLTPIELAGRTGWQYQISGLGEYTIIVLPVAEGEAMVISYLVADPEAQGYEHMVQQILASLAFVL